MFAEQESHCTATAYSKVGFSLAKCNRLTGREDQTSPTLHLPSLGNHLACRKCAVMRPCFHLTFRFFSTNVDTALLLPAYLGGTFSCKGRNLLTLKELYKQCLKGGLGGTYAIMCFELSRQSGFTGLGMTLFLLKVKCSQNTPSTRLNSMLIRLITCVQ